MEVRRPRDRERVGVEIYGFDASHATDEDFELIRKTVYHEKVVVLKDQHLDVVSYRELGQRIGRLVPYYEEMYHHPEVPEVFVSSNVEEPDGKRIGVPKTGKFWHSDYQFMPEPFAFTIFYPQVLPPGNRGTFFISLAEAYRSLPEDLRRAAHGRRATHSVRRFFKIRPEDVYRPLGEVMTEVEQRTPPVTFPLVIEHPVTEEPILYLSEGFTIGLDEDAPRGLLEQLLEVSGQLDITFQHPLIRTHTYDEADIAIWDNRTMVHRALHVTGDDPAVSWRLTVLDGLPLYRRSR